MNIDFKERLEASSLESIIKLLLDPSGDLSLKKSLLDNWHHRGEHPKEVAFIAKHFRELARDPEVSGYANQAIDVCGTGGDGAGTFNISSVVSFILATAGIPVFKHGNRSITSKSGSADFLERLSIPIHPDNDSIAKSLQEKNYAFFFAPDFHPAFKAIVPVRQALAKEGKKSVFNLLGPLINPGKPAFQVVGVFHPNWVEPVAEALDEIGLARGLVVCSEYQKGAYVDELTCVGSNRVAGVGSLSSVRGTWEGSAHGLVMGEISDLAGGKVKENQDILQDLLSGRANPVLRDTLCWNAGVALWVANRVANIKEGIDQSREILEQGKLTNWLATW